MGTPLILIGRRLPPEHPPHDEGRRQPGGAIPPSSGPAPDGCDSQRRAFSGEIPSHSPRPGEYEEGEPEDRRGTVAPAPPLGPATVLIPRDAVTGGRPISTLNTHLSQLETLWTQVRQAHHGPEGARTAARQQLLERYARPA